MPLERAFLDRTQSIFYTMRKRFAEKRDKNGRLRRHGMAVPFELDQFREWLLVQLGGRRDGCALCEYCKRPLCSQDFCIDHKIPVSRGGSVGLENLTAACDECNRAKGRLTVLEFIVFRDSMDALLRSGDIGPEGYKDIWARLRGQLKTFPARAKKGKATQPFLDMPPEPRIAGF